MTFARSAIVEISSIDFFLNLKSLALSQKNLQSLIQNFARLLFELTRLNVAVLTYMLYVCIITFVYHTNG